MRKTNQSKALVSWTVAEPEDGDQFLLQWGNDGINFSDINFQTASTTLFQYSYSHLPPDWEKNQYYRLKVISISGNVFYSAIKVLRAEQNSDAPFKFYPNPVTDKLRIESQSSNQRPHQVRILNAAGVIVRTEMITALSINNSITLDLSSLSSGAYFLELYSAHGVTRKVFMKQ